MRVTLFWKSPVSSGWTSIDVPTASEADPAVIAARLEIERSGIRTVTRIVFW